MSKQMRQPCFGDVFRRCLSASYEKQEQERALHALALRFECIYLYTPRTLALHTLSLDQKCEAH